MLFIVFVLSLPVYTLAIYGLLEPREAILFMDRWKYKEEPEFSDLQMKWFKWGNIAAIVFATILIIISAIITFTPEEQPEIPEQYYNSSIVR
ncbi:hypothetical protein [Ureibacillus sp. GCM10028918]|uniref:hypothetical protein n=1 Tax=Ureibacillus sp. GCM10028918 TaxID=3273429 RepID=UPI00361CB685